MSEKAVLIYVVQKCHFYTVHIGDILETYSGLPQPFAYFRLGEMCPETAGVSYTYFRNGNRSSRHFELYLNKQVNFDMNNYDIGQYQIECNNMEYMTKITYRTCE